MTNIKRDFKTKIYFLICFVLFCVSPLACMDKKDRESRSHTTFMPFRDPSSKSSNGISQGRINEEIRIFSFSEDSSLSDVLVSDYSESEEEHDLENVFKEYGLEGVFQEGLKYAKEDLDREEDDRYRKNDDLALACFQYAAEREHPKAQYNLAGMYVGENNILVIKWLAAAGMQHHARAKVVLSRFCALDRTLLAPSYKPYIQHPKMNSILNEMISELGLSDGANTSPYMDAQYSLLSPYFEDFKNSLVNVQNYIAVFNRPGFLINCLRFINVVPCQHNADRGFLKELKCKEKVFICFGEDNVKDAVLLLNFLKEKDQDSLLVKGIFTRMSWEINFGDETERQIFWGGVDLYISLLENMKVLLKDLATQICEGVNNRNKLFADHYSILFD